MVIIQLLDVHTVLQDVVHNIGSYLLDVHTVLQHCEILCACLARNETVYGHNELNGLPELSLLRCLAQSLQHDMDSV